MTTTYWVPTIGNVLPPLPVAQGGTGGTTSQQWLPGDDGFLGAESDPATQSGGGLAIAGTLYLSRINARSATTITNLWYGVGTAGANTAGTAFVGLYSAAGTLLSGSADQSAALSGTTGWKSLPLTTPQPVAAGTVVYAAILNNLTTTQPSLLRQNNSVNADPQAVVSNATQRWGQFAAVGGTLPASLTMSSMAATAFTYVVLWT